MVYRAGLIPAGAVARWRTLFARAGEDPLFVMAQSFGDRDPARFGMDAAVEFPPHKHTDHLQTINDRLHLLDTATTARIYDYEEIARATDLSPQPYPLIRTAFPSWDNDPRRQGAGMVVHGATPAAYQAWLARLIAAARQQPVAGEALVCINAWNEWGEGAYLEPDQHFGAAFLNATARAAVGEGVGQDAMPRTRLLLVGHDAFPAGAQLLLLHLGRSLKQRRGLDIAFLLLGEGALLPQYRALAPTTVLADPALLPAHAAAMPQAGFSAALVNSAAAAAACTALAAAGITTVLLVHELPRLLRERHLVAPAREAAAAAHHVVFGAAHVRDRFEELVPLRHDRTTIRPQGLYRPVDSPGAAGRDARRAQLRIPAAAVLAIGLGYADLRKGFDLFLQAWRAAQRPPARARPRSVHFLWVGDIDPTVHLYLGAELAVAEATGTFHHLPFQPDGADWLAAADIHLLTSREDPLPTVVLEAMSAGLPTVAFEETGGAPDLLRECRAGVAVPLGDVQSVVHELRRLAPPPPGASRAAAPTGLASAETLAACARTRFAFAAYADHLLGLALPGLLDVAVAIPTYNYAHYLPGRLASIFAQTHPVAEVVVLDDASTDTSEAAAHHAAEEAGRTIRWEAASANGGSVFRQWRRAALATSAEWLWIAEADDLAEPGFLAALAHSLHNQPGAVMAFTDSRAIDAEGRTLWPDHQAYYRTSGATLLAQDGLLDAADLLAAGLGQRNLILNASAVLWRRTALLAALDRCGPELDTFTMAGDWRLYAELLSAGGQVAYVAQPLNGHRRHPASVTHRLGADRHLDEVRRMQHHMRRLLGARPGLREAQRRALDDTRRALNLIGGDTGQARSATGSG